MIDIKEKLRSLFRNRSHDVYCPHCTSCGETGCCPPTICSNHPKGFYCQSNMGELKTSYHTLTKMWGWLSENETSETLTIKDALTKLDEINDKEDDEYREYLESLPTKLTLFEKIKKIFTI